MLLDKMCRREIHTFLIPEMPDGVASFLKLLSSSLKAKEDQTQVRLRQNIISVGLWH